MPSSSVRPVPLVLAWIFLAAGTVPAKAFEVRHHGAHVHGVSDLDVAIDRGVVEVDIHGPGINFVGFEHAPRTDQEKQALADATGTLQQPASWLVFPEAARCTLTSAKVADAGKPDEPDEDGHMDVSAHYRFACAQPDALTGFDVGLLRAFPHTVKVNVDMVTPSGQGQATVDASLSHVTVPGTSP